MTPVGELRASIPMALGVYHLDWPRAYFISIIGNLVPVILILFFLERVSSFLSKKFAVCRRFFDWLFQRTRRKHGDALVRYGALALFLFTAVPLPFTGGWTAALAAFLFGIPRRRALPLIAGGVAVAGVLVLALYQAGIFIFNFQF